MPQVYFIDLPTPQKTQAICKQSVELYGKGHRLLILAENQEHALEIDKQLWSFQPESFLPHLILPADQEEIALTPILISCEELWFDNIDALLLGTEASFDYMNRFPMIIDFAETYDPHKQKASRDRFRNWKQADVTPEYLRGQR